MQLEPTLTPIPTEAMAAVDAVRSDRVPDAARRASGAGGVGTDVDDWQAAAVFPMAAALTGDCTPFLRTIGGAVAASATGRTHHRRRRGLAGPPRRMVPHGPVESAFHAG